MIGFNELFCLGRRSCEVLSLLVFIYDQFIGDVVYCLSNLSFCIIDLVRIVVALKPIDDFLIFYRILGGCKYILGAFKVKKVVCGQDRLQTMSDHYDCQLSFLLFLNVEDSILDLCLTLRVKCARSFIEHQNLWSLDQGTGNGDALFLASR